MEQIRNMYASIGYETGAGIMADLHRIPITIAVTANDYAVLIHERLLVGTFAGINIAAAIRVAWDSAGSYRGDDPVR